jgi:hypothetical protein
MLAAEGRPMSKAPSLGFSSLMLGCLGLVACTFDPSTYHPTGGGGSTASLITAGPGTTNQAGSGVTASSASTTALAATGSGVTTTGVTTASSTTTGSVTASSSVSGTGGGAVTLTPCGIPPDHFNNFPTGWNQQDATIFKYGMGNMNVGVEAQVQNQWAGAWIDPMAFDDCYASIMLVDTSGAGKAYLNLYQVTTQNSVQIDYDSFWKTVNTPNALPVAAAQDRPVALGFAIHAGSVYFFFIKHGATTWSQGSKNSVPWIGANDIALGFGDQANSSQWAKFDDFNVIPITGAELW